MRVDDKVICINSDDVDLTFGQKYIVCRVDNFGVWVWCDRGIPKPYNKSRFMLFDVMKKIVNKYE